LELLVDTKSRDSAFGVVLFGIGVFVTAESLRMIHVATLPPFQITDLIVTPGLLPCILGLFLAFFSLLLLIETVKGAGSPGKALAENLKTAWRGILAAFGDPDFRIMLAGVAWMFVYIFFILGEIPFWLGASGFLLILFVFLRFTGRGMGFPAVREIGTLALVTAGSVILIMALFQGVFKTTLP
jgi:hypothetical protein